MKRVIAFFDFDGTITTKDSLLEFIKYSRGKFSFYRGFALHAPILIAYKLKLVSNQRAKEIIFRHFFKNAPIDQFNQLCTGFVNDVMPSLIRPKALKEINKLKEAGAEVVVVSASPENWLSCWTKSVGVKCIGTRMVVENNKITGRISGRNCHGEEKVRRILEEYDLSTFSSVYCYGDTSGDRPMLSLGHYRFYKPFR